MPKKGYKYNKKKEKHWVFSTPRREALKKAQKTHSILVRIGKLHRNEHAHKFKI